MEWNFVKLWPIDMQLTPSLCKIFLWIRQILNFSYELMVIIIS